MPVTRSSALASAPASTSAATGKGLFVGDWFSGDKITLLVESSSVFAGLQQFDQSAFKQALSGSGDDQSAMRIPGTTAAAGAVGTSSAHPTRVQDMTNYHRVSELYRAALVRYRERLVSYSEPDATEVQLVTDIHAAFHLAETLYLPTDGVGASVVGEEILHWLNAYDVAPTTEEGQDIASAETPYDHPRYWDYVYQCVLRGFNTSAASVLGSLASHPSSVVGRVSRKAIDLLQTFPRSTQHQHEASFVQVRKQWLVQIRAVLSGLEAEMDEMEEELGQGEQGEDMRLEYEAQYRCLFELMAGVKERVFEACADWKEALGSWGLLVQPSMKRDDVPDVMSIILDQFPPDSTSKFDKAVTAFTRGDVVQAANECRDYDPWLAVHLVGLLGTSGALEDDEEEDKGIRTVKDCIHEYSNVLLEDQGLWRMAMDYLAVIGRDGRRRMRNVILDVPLQMDATDSSVEEDEEMDEDADEVGQEKGKQKEEESGVSKRFQRVEELLRACVDHDMELEARAICKKVAAELSSKREYGLAVSYCVRAGDATQVRNIADAVLEEYVNQGEEEFLALVDGFPTSLLQRTSRLPGMDEEREDRTVAYGRDKSIYSERLAFLGKYRDFHRLYAEERLHEATAVLVSTLLENQAPERFWAVLLLDSIPLLESELMLFEEDGIMELIRHYEQVTAGARAHPAEAEHYLGMMERLLQHQSGKGESTGAKQRRGLDVSAALKRLDVVRLGLARSLSKAFLLENSRIPSLV